MDRIAVGGMGEVWRAADLHLDRMVAAKVLRAEFAGDTSFLARMRAEARNAAGLSHINVTAMYDYGEQSGAGYLIMELVEGEPMSDMLSRERTLAPGQLLPILAQTARGLHAAHMAGVVHRDVKPSNLLITRDGTVKITDFGIALGANQAPMTAAGMVMGTAQYLPPEQAMGKAAQGVGDIYALGVIAYEALVGRRPFTGATQVDIAFAHVNQPVPQMPERVDPRVRDVVMSMLDKDPERRPRSGASLARILDDLLRELQAEVAHGRVAPHLAARAEVAAIATQAMPMTGSARDEAQLVRERARQRPRDQRTVAATGAAAAAAAPADHRARLSVVAPVVGSSALQLDHLESEAAPEPAAAATAVAAAAAATVVEQAVTGRSAVEQATVEPAEPAQPAIAERAVLEKAAGVRRPPLPSRPRRNRAPEPAGAAWRPDETDARYAVETPDRGFAPAWAPLGAGVRTVVERPALTTRPRRRRHERIAGVWAWQTLVKVLVVAAMLIVLVLWLGTLAQAAALAPALGAAGMLGKQSALSAAERGRSSHTRRRPTSG
ncbi:serine/threonine-protein kinase [Pseudactinotalea suaedae]|uniref:serine/threonine-protein kinase n=1 Tax=Pseudactinotalea suaedae TaxID=1524924 RepID=UPI001F4F4217|nr:serine/threonine-protein kinase [Pseudactinotalea suaedae]